MAGWSLLRLSYSRGSASGSTPMAGSQSTATPTAAAAATPAAPKTSFGAGTFRVGVDIAAGNYRAPGGDLCYWARVSGFGGTLGEIIANDNVTGAAIVSIDPSDAGFMSHGCGEWTMAG